MKRISAGVLPIQAAVAKASPSAWVDGLVSAVGPAGAFITLMDGRLLALTTEASLAVGEPVAWHPVAEILAGGRMWVAARLTDAPPAP